MSIWRNTMAKKKAAVKAATKKSTKLTGSISVNATIGAGTVEFPYSTLPNGELPASSKAYVEVGSFSNPFLPVQVKGTTPPPPITAFGFVVEDYEVQSGYPPNPIDFELIYNPSSPTKGELSLKGYQGTGKKLRVTILTRKSSVMFAKSKKSTPVKGKKASPIKKR
jgi:hypothetical protein